jgi:hypothetical protein
MKRALRLSTAMALAINATCGTWMPSAFAQDESQFKLYLTIPFGDGKSPQSSEPRFGLRFDQQLPDNVTLYGDSERLRRMFDMQFTEDGLSQLNFGGLSLPMPSDRLYQNGEDLPLGSQLTDWLPDECLTDQLSFWACMLTLAALGAGLGYGIYELTSEDGNNNNNNNSPPSPPPPSPPPPSPPPPESPPPPPPIEEGGLDMPGDEVNAYV